MNNAKKNLEYNKDNLDGLELKVILANCNTPVVFSVDMSLVEKYSNTTSNDSLTSILV